MAKKTARKPAVAAHPSKLRASVMAIKGLLAAALVAGAGGGIAMLGKSIAAKLPDDERFAVPLERLDFEAPSHVDRRTFLAEVRYLSGLPDPLMANRADLPERLRKAFAGHPWIAGVGDIAVSPQRRIAIALRFREPVLAIDWRIDGERETRALDIDGVLLPASARTDGLAKLANERNVPKAEAGRPWPEDEVRRAAELVVRHSATAIERTRNAWKLTERSGTILTIGTP